MDSRLELRFDEAPQPAQAVGEHDREPWADEGHVEERSKRTAASCVVQLERELSSRVGVDEALAPKRFARQRRLHPHRSSVRWERLHHLELTLKRSATKVHDLSARGGGLVEHPSDLLDRDQPSLP